MKLDLYDLVVPNMSKKAQRAMRKAMKKSDREQRRLLRKYKKIIDKKH